MAEHDGDRFYFELGRLFSDIIDRLDRLEQQLGGLMSALTDAADVALANFNTLVDLFHQAIATDTADQNTIDVLNAQVAALTADQATAIATLGNITPQPGEVLPTPPADTPPADTPPAP